MMYLLDTNTLIYFFKGEGDVARHLLNTSPKDLAMPAIVLYELEYGIAKSSSPQKRQNQLEEITSQIEIIPFANKEAKVAAAIRAKLEKKGEVIGPHDILIAGTAVANNKTLVTRNVGEFARILSLTVESWY
ncbi:MAG: type II toxin-antitoxin system VapC family toxin [Nitrospinae bacterium]|nr:type II toxin-antitoxin system VapC family toxin [Nitrospinota bacterium]